VLAVLAGLVSLACIVASAHRLRLAVSPTQFDLGLLLGALKPAGSLERLREGLAQMDGWERDLVDAALASPPAARGPLIDEQVLEADWEIQRWARAPRVAASVSTSAGFLCACVILIQALGGDPADLSMSTGASSPLGVALGALALGIVGTSFSVAVHVRAQTVTRQRRLAVDQLADRLRMLVIS
jgi:hypothetical protein